MITQETDESLNKFVQLVKEGVLDPVEWGNYDV